MITVICLAPCAADFHMASRTSTLNYRVASALITLCSAAWRHTTPHERRRRPRSWVWTGCWEISRWSWLTAPRASAYLRMFHFFFGRHAGWHHSVHIHSYSTSCPVSTRMGDHLLAGILSWCVTSQLGQLCLASLRGRYFEYQLCWGKGGNVTSAGGGR